MTKLQTLTEGRTSLKNQLDNLDRRIDAIENRLNSEKVNILKKYIDGYDYFNVSYSHETVSVSHKDSHYTLLDMHVYDEYSSEDGRVYNKMVFNTSSFRTEYNSSSDMKWVEERFKMLSFYSQVLSDFSDDILAEFNSVKDKYSKLTKALYTSRRTLAKDLRVIDHKISTLEKEILLNKLMSEDGISINESDSKSLPSLQVKFDWELYSVKSLRVVKRSVSGKSVDIQVAVRRGYFGEDKKLEVIDVDRVRLSNIEQFLYRNQDYIA